MKQRDILSTLFQIVLKDLEIQDKIGAYVMRYLNRTETTKEWATKTGAGILASIDSEKMTWKTLMFLLFKVLNIKSLRVSLEIRHSNGVVYVHKTKEFKEVSSGNGELDEAEVADNKKTN